MYTPNPPTLCGRVHQERRCLGGQIRFLAFLAAAVFVTLILGSVVTPTPAAGAVPAVSPDGLWTWSRPLPHGYRASAISSPSPDTCFVAVGLPDVLLTCDGGVSWSWSHSGLSPEGAILGVDFVSASEGWAWGTDTDATGDEAVLLHSNDAGATWQEQLRASQTEFVDLSFADPAAVWVAGRDAIQLDRLVLFMSADGGATWTAVAPPADDDVTYEAVAALGSGRALLAEAVWSRGAGSGEVVGTRIWRTDDGGSHWTAPTTLGGVHFVAVAFATPEHGWAAAQSGSMWATDDGGASWRRQYRSSADLNAAAVDVIGDNIWAVGSGGVLRSSNDGRTWRRSAAVSGRHVSFSSPFDGWIANGTVYRRTMDGGGTWSRVTSAPQTAVTSLDAADATIWAAADHVIKSPDLGGHWLRATDRGRLKAVAASAASRAWAVGAGGVIVRTTDGGAHWRVQTSGTAATLRDVSFVSSLRGWAGGDRGVLLRTVDGGRHWRRGSVGTSAGIIAVEFGDANHGLALLSPRQGRATVLRSADGGRTWSRTLLPSAARLPTALAFTASLDAVVVARDASGLTSCWRSSDGGRTWQPGGGLPGRDVWNAVAGVGTMVCAVGSSGAVALSDDHGATWSFAGRPAGPVPLTAAAYLPDQRVAVAGQTGAVLISNPGAAQR